MTFLLSLVVLGLVVVLVVAVVLRVQRRHQGAGGEGADLIAYLLLAIAVGTAAFSLSRLGRAAFPGRTVVFEPRREVAFALAGLIVATPVAAILWRRQAMRRREHPASPGWTVYLALVEAVFMTALVISAHQLITWLLEGGAQPTWTDAVVFAAVVAWHELAARSTPPASDSADLPRVVGSVIGLVATAIGVGGLLTWVLELVYATITPIAGGIEPLPYLAAALVGVPVWYFRWWHRPPAAPSTPTHVLNVVASVLGLALAIGAASAILIRLIVFVFTTTPTAAAHFDFVPVALSTGSVAALVWAHHRRRLGGERTEQVRAYHYSMAALGLVWAVGGATGLVTLSLDRPALVVATEDIVGTATLLIIALVVWFWFWRICTAAPRGVETASISRRIYLVGLGLIAGLTSAFSLIATLVILIQHVLDAAGPFDSLALPGSLFVFAGLATWHLLRLNTQDRKLLASTETITPFNVTLICSHPGMIATLFPKAARLRVVYRDDDSGHVDDEMAARIVEAVGYRSSLVWVDESGFRVAPAR